ncbi:MAG: GAK system XXXCH domain-containing protein [Desulfovibrionaceae bacterium]|nr:GAK system XXXCH domain-containing protein [Desulfovibrionaceae bacterium]MBF0512604.1 GAK system XXXCH domain-containing protein [Desulfovibrionaceae bacterium]
MNFVDLKHSLEKVFQSIKATTDEGSLPSLEDATQFAKLAQMLLLQAKEQWAGEAEDFAHLAAQLLSTVKKGHAEDAVLLVESLDDAKDYCHRSVQE